MSFSSASRENGTTTHPMSTISTRPYTSAAAGHQGISTDSTGAMLIKPCTQAEVDFYESAKDHPNFQAHMPTYMGQLRLGNNNLQTQASILQTHQADESSPTAVQSPISALPRTSTFGQPLRTTTSHSHRRTESGHIVSDPRIARSANKEWTPSGGAKLSSNLSIVLSNATAGFCKPNVIDLKLGARLWDDDAPEPKRKKLDEVSASSTSGTLGFRVAGMKVFVGDAEVSREVNTEVDEGYKTYNKFYGRDSITKDNIKSAFEAFLWSLDHLVSVDDTIALRKALLRRRMLLRRLLRETESIEYVLETEESRMYSASVLMVYEGDSEALETVVGYKEEGGKLVDTETMDEDDEEDEEGNILPGQKIHEVVLIDFAHAHWTPGQGPDENALKGVRSIKSILEQLLLEVEGKLQ